MRKLVFSILALLALFSALRAWTETAPGPGVLLHPGLVEVRDASSSLQFAFGIAGKQADQTWNLLPLSLVYRSGSRTVTLSFNGLSFLLRGGVSVGQPLRITTPRAGNVVSVGGKVTVQARVDGDVWTLGADIELRPGADVTGDVVALGGRVTAASRSIVRGSVNQLPQMRIPLVGVLGTGLSVQILAFGRQFLGYLLLGVALFLSCFYGTRRALGIYQGFSETWKASLVTLAVSLVLVPLLVVLLIVSVVGLFFLPVLVFALAVLGLNGFLLLCARLGGAIRKAPGESGNAYVLFTSGLLGLFVVKLPALAGILLTLVRNATVVRAGRVLQLLSLGLLIAGMLYGLGASLSQMRVRAARPAA